MKAGIFVDAENVMRNGGWGMRYDILKNIISEQESTIVRANVYMAVDKQREYSDFEYRSKKESYRNQVRRCGFKIVTKEIRRYTDEDGKEVIKGNTDLDLAVDSLLQSQNLDYVVLVTGDGDFVRLVTALQNSGTKVDVISFHNTSRALKEAADHHCYGFLIPDLLPTEEGRERGTLFTVDEERYFGHIAVLDSYRSYGQNVFCHGSEFLDQLSNREFAQLKERSTILEFTVVEGDRGPQAKEVEIIEPE